MNNLIVGTLTLNGDSAATITMEGEWSSADARLAAELNEVFGPGSPVLGPSVIPHAVRALRTAGVQMGGKVQMIHQLGDLPDGAIS